MLGIDLVFKSVLSCFKHGKLGEDCNKTDQIIRAQVQKQAPKRLNFQT
jgi:hypothetical protein